MRKRKNDGMDGPRGCVNALLMMAGILGLVLIAYLCAVNN